MRSLRVYKFFLQIYFSNQYWWSLLAGITWKKTSRIITFLYLFYSFLYIRGLL